MPARCWCGSSGGCERHNPDGRMALIGIAVGTEVLCA